MATEMHKTQFILIVILNETPPDRLHRPEMSIQKKSSGETTIAIL